MTLKGPIPLPECADASAADAVEVFTTGKWLQTVGFLWVLFAVPLGLLAAVRVEPTDGGWPPVLGMVGGFCLAWSVWMIAALPDRVVIFPDRICRRVRRRWLVIRADEVTGVEIRPLVLGGGAHQVKIRSARGIIRLPLSAGGKGKETRAILDRFLEAAGAVPPTATGAQVGRVPMRTIGPRPGVRRSWVSFAITVSACLTAVVGLLRLLFG